MGGSAADKFGDVWLSSDGGRTFTEATPTAAWPKRDAHASVVLPNGHVLVMGGNTATNGPLHDVWSSSDGGTTWHEVVAAANWSARFWFAAVRTAAGLIVVSGGHSDTTCNDVWTSSDGGATWKGYKTPPNWGPREGHTSVVLSGDVLVLGGYTGSALLNDVWSSPGGNGTSWIQLKANDPSIAWAARRFHTSVVTPGGAVLVAGGSNLTVPFRDVWSSVDGRTWTELVPSAAWKARSGHASVVALNGGVLILGGQGAAESEYFSDVWTSPSCTAGYGLGPDGALCTKCGPGTASAGMGTGGRAVPCTACPSGSFTNVSGSGSCTQCAAGTAARGAATQCARCPAGSYSAAGAASCTPCQPGSSTSDPSVACRACGPGTLAAHANATRCSPCPAGSYTTAERSTSCTACAPGTSTGHPAVPCAGCKPGFFAPEASATLCKPCRAGTYNATHNATWCSGCEPGHFSHEGASNCSACDPGWWGGGGSSTRACSGPCAAGRYGDVQGQTNDTCVGPCPAGAWCPAGTANSTGVPCRAGTFSPATGASACATCIAGAYCPGSGNTHTTQCPVGRWGGGGSLTKACSGPCAAGRYGDAQGQTKDTCVGPCPAGAWCPPGSTSATAHLCQPGKYSNTTGASTAAVCGDCPAGSYCPRRGMSQPLLCGVNTYSSSVGSASCTQCSLGGTTGGSIGEISASSCIIHLATLVVGGLLLVIAWAGLKALSRCQTKRIRALHGKLDARGNPRMRDYTALLTALLAAYHFAADVYFLQQHVERDSPSIALWVFGVATVVAFGGNFFWCTATMNREARNYAPFRKWLHANWTMAAIVLVLGTTKVGSLRLLRCGAFGASGFEAQVRRRTMVHVRMASGVLSVLEDVPQLVCALLIASAHGQVLALRNIGSIASGSVSLLVQIATIALGCVLSRHGSTVLDGDDTDVDGDDEPIDSEQLLANVVRHGANDTQSVVSITAAEYVLLLDHRAAQGDGGMSSSTATPASATTSGDAGAAAATGTT